MLCRWFYIHGVVVQALFIHVCVCVWVSVCVCMCVRVSKFDVRIYLYSCCGPTCFRRAFACACLCLCVLRACVCVSDVSLECVSMYLSQGLSISIFSLPHISPSPSLHSTLPHVHVTHTNCGLQRIGCSFLHTHTHSMCRIRW